MTTRQVQRICREAARMVAEEEEDYSCVALTKAEGKVAVGRRVLQDVDHSLVAREYSKVMFGRSKNLRWFFPSITKDERVIALLIFAAAYPDLKKWGVFDE